MRVPAIELNNQMVLPESILGSPISRALGSGFLYYKSAGGCIFDELFKDDFML